jgi:hypothetical protein
LEKGVKAMTVPADIHGVYFEGDSNNCEVYSSTAKTVCMFQQTNVCIFLLLDSSSGGFSCTKFNSMVARKLRDHLTKGNIHGRIGNCILLGRKEQETVTV